MPGQPLEQLFRSLRRGPVILRVGAGARQFAGRTTLNSGSAAVTVSNANVASNMLLRMACFPSSIGAAAHSGGAVVVNSVVHGVSFSLARAFGTAVPWDETVSWEIARQS